MYRSQALSKGCLRKFSSSSLKTQRTRAPSFFDNPDSIPAQYTLSNSEHAKKEHQPSSTELDNSQTSKRPAKDFASMLAMVALVYFALDNYQGRLKAEKLNQETSAIHMKTLQLQQQNYLKARKQQDLRMLQERADVSKRCFKMSMHIALLRKQLNDLGVNPKDIPDVVEEFDKNVKVSNSIQNLTGNAIWLTDDSEYKGLMPDYREYDRKG